MRPDQSQFKANFLERILDRALAVVAPGKAASIMRQREAFKAFAYKGGQRGQRNRESATIFPNSSPESSLIQLERIQCMWESRSLSDNFGVADYIYKLYCDYCIPDFSKIRWNTGNPDDDVKLKDRFLTWSRGICDYSGRDTLNQLMRIAKKSQLRDGDIALRCVPDDIKLGNVTRKCMRLQLIEADCIGSPFNVVVAPDYIGGLILDPITKRVLKYDIYDRPPQGSTYIPLAKVDASEIIHFRSLRRAAQYRGIPLLAPSLPAYVDLKEILENERVSTKAQSTIWAFIASETGDSSDDETVYPGLGSPAATDPGTGKPNTYQDLIPGKAMYGNPGEKPEFLKNERPSPAFQGLVKTLFVEIFCCAGIDYAFGYDASDLQGTAMRLVSAKTQRTFQQDWTFNEEYLFCPVVSRWLQHEVENGYMDDLSEETLQNRAYQRFSFTQPAHPSADVGRESQANLAELQAKIKSRHTIAAEQGIDWDVENEQMKKEDADLSGGRMAISDSLAKALGDQGVKALQSFAIAYGTGQISHEIAVGFAMVGFGLDQKSAEMLFPKSSERPPAPAPGTGNQPGGGSGGGNPPPASGEDGANGGGGKGLSRPQSLSNHGSKGCVMANLSAKDAAPILRYVNALPESDLYLGEDGTDSYGPNYGRETEPHVTALYGLLMDDVRPVEDVCEDFGELTATLGPVEMFSNPKYDVLKVTVTSPDLVRLNAALKGLPYSSDFPDYKPHLTLAYLKPGRAAKYIGATPFAGTQLAFDEVVFNDSKHVKTKIPLQEDAKDLSRRFDKSVQDEARADDGKWTSGGGTGSKALVPAVRVGEGKEAKLVHPVHGGDVPAHITALRLPPAWKDVKINPDPKGALLAQGKDAKGRLQSVYSKKFVEEQSAKKFARIKDLLAKHDDIVAQNTRDLSDPAKKENADVFRLINATGIRPGSDTDTGAKKKAYGATTLLGQHVTLDDDGNTVLKFVGKKGVDLSIPVHDPEIAAMLHDRAGKAGPDGKLFDTNDAKLRNYTHTLGDFKTKDFRTLKGTKTAMEEVSKMTPPTTQKEYDKQALDVAKIVSKKLGNTPKIALESYIDPSVFERWKSNL